MKNYIWELQIDYNPEFKFYFFNKLSPKKTAEFIKRKDIPNDHDDIGYSMDWSKVKIEDSKNFQLWDNRLQY